MNLEDALQEQEERVDVLLKSAARYLGVLKAWKKACQTGHIGNRQKAATQAAEMAPALVPPTTEAAVAWEFDVRDYLESEAWRQELQAAADKHGLRLLPEGANLISSPVIVRAQSGRGILQLGKVNWPTIHPALTAAELKRLRDRTSGANSQEFLESLYAVWNRENKEGHPVARFRDIYDLFCLTPGWKKENPPAAFGQSIYALHRSGIRETRAGRTVEIEYSSGNAKDKDIFTVYSEDGLTLRYYGIRFR